LLAVIGVAAMTHEAVAQSIRVVHFDTARAVTAPADTKTYARFQNCSAGGTTVLYNTVVVDRTERADFSTDRTDCDHGLCVTVVTPEPRRPQGWGHRDNRFGPFFSGPIYSIHYFDDGGIASRHTTILHTPLIPAPTTTIAPNRGISVGNSSARTVTFR